MEIDERALAPTRWFFKVPSYRRLFLYIFLYAFTAGFIIYLNGHSLSDAFLFGSTAGIFILALPAIFSSLLAVSLFSRKEIKGQLKYFLLTGFVAEIIASIAYLVATLFFGGTTTGPELVLLGNAVVFVVWYSALTIGFQKNFYRALPVSFLHPLFSLSLIVIWKAYGILEPSLNQVGLIAIPKLIIASVVMLLALSSISYLLNAPAKRNFGVSAISALTLFVAQWVRGSKGLEGLLDEMGEEVQTSVGVAVFSAKKRIKAVLLVPHVHYGPLGNLGGSELPWILSKRISERLNAPAFVFHGTALPDFNPVHAEQETQVEEALMQAIKTAQAKTPSPSAHLLSSVKGDSHADGFGCPSGAFLTLSRAPKPTDDINYAAGRALANLVRGRYDNVVIVDRHNSKTEEGKRKWDVGSEEYAEFEDCLWNLKSTATGRLKLGVAQNPLSQYTAPQGIAPGGLKVSVLEVNRKKWCIAVFDANNILPEFRKRLIDSVSRFGFDFVDVCTTDTHVVNTISGIHNPLGLSMNAAAQKELVSVFAHTVKEAGSKLERVSVAVATAPLTIKVLGSGKASEVTSTVNSILAIAKIVAPIAFILALALALLALRLV